MYCLDKIKFVGEIFWLDSLKLGAFIAAGQNDKEEIRKYLTDNYECNKKYAAFCMKK